LLAIAAIMNPSNALQRRHGRYRVASAIALALVAVVTGMSALAGNGTLMAQAPNPCALVTTDDVKPLASVNQSVGNGLATSVDGGPMGCRYTVGEGMGRLTLNVVVAEPSRMFAGMGPDMIKQALQTSVRAETADAVIPDVGDAAVFKADSPLYTRTIAYVKGRIIQVQLDGLDAIDRKDRMIALLKSAASRL
jgi:hypothetical protein